MFFFSLFFRHTQPRTKRFTMECKGAERELSRLAAQGSTDAYAQLRQLHQSLIRATLQRHASQFSHSDLEDLEQEVWIAVWKALPRFEGRSALKTWLLGVAKNVFSAWLRRKRNNELTLLRFSALNEGETQETEKADPLGVLHVSAAVGRLSEREHQVIELRYFQ